MFILTLNLVYFVSVLSLASTDNWNTLWRDDFNGPAGSPPKGWRFDTGNNNGWGNNEVEVYTNDPSNVGLDGNGHLLITPRRDSSGKWTSARIESDREDFRPPGGGKMAIEGRLRLPDVTGDAALGYWPAFWALGADIRHGKPWPGVGEFDLMENVNGINKVRGTLHCGVRSGGPCKEPNGLGHNWDCPNSNCVSDFHVYRFEWDESTNPPELRWYVDGQQYHKVTKTRVGDSAWNKFTSNGYFILLNVAIGGNYPNGVANKNTPTSATEPGHSMIVDYVAVYASN